MRNNIKGPTPNEERIIKLMVLIGLFSILNFLVFFFQPENRGNFFLFFLLSITILYSASRKLYMWYNYANISVPDEPVAVPDFTVDILTTYFPGEPYQMVITTLEAITKISYPHTTYLCDEANDPYLKKFCEENSIIHVTRDNRIDAKAGNINNALRNHGKGEICVILDPDHIPEPNFLDPILPHFSDPKIGFVQIVQSYYNIKETLVARGAAEQTFQFYGPMMMTLNSYETVNAIGANCVFRRKALDSIGGHAPGLCEDMHTAMLLYAKKWKAVYVPEVLAKGLAPSSLTTYFKQQLKWTRGTFDLLFKVYPKVFKKLSFRQKIHFGVLPLHYLCGVIYFINFLIPVLALFMSENPWKGDLMNFVWALLPLAVSALLIRTFVQKWVIEKDERGFHIVGGLLQINTWWIYFLGFFYTLIDKKVPYLPTPKQSEFNTNLKIVIPNAVIAFISLLAVVYGLQRNFTPYSVIMAGFALFNTGIMIFGIYLSVRSTNQNRILRSNLDEKALVMLWNIKQILRDVFHSTFVFTRRAAFPILVVVLIAALSFKNEKEDEGWDEIKPLYFEPVHGKYLGIFKPLGKSGLADLEDINSIEARQNLNFDIISFYLAWSDEGLEEFPDNLLNNISNKNAIPMITWEPWASQISSIDSIPELQEEKKIFEHISNGTFDSYIKTFAGKLADFKIPVFLRFAHEFDNPSYPWSQTGLNTSEEFKAAWKHVYEIFQQEGAGNVAFVWNPWKSERMKEYYPGDQYVDWIGVTALNYGSLNPDKIEHSFKDLYKPFRDELKTFTSKPVMLAEFGSVKFGGTQEKWIAEAMETVKNEFQEIGAVVFFSSEVDKNIPFNNWYKKETIDWTNDTYPPEVLDFDFSGSTSDNGIIPLTIEQPQISLGQFNIQGVNYKKGEEWRDNYYVVSRNVLVNDLDRMKKFGFNTIKFKGGTVYEYNILKYSAAKEFQVLYEFPLNHYEGYLNQQDKLEILRQEIISTIEFNKKKSSIIGYVFNGNVEPFFSKPLSQLQQQAFLRWFQSLSLEIKKIAPQKMIILEIPLNRETINFLKNYSKSLPVDAYNLIVQEENDLEEIKSYADNNNIQLLFTPTDPGMAINSDVFDNLPVIMPNWQDERLSGRISFDGLIDFHGWIKAKTKKIKPNNREQSFGEARILKPAIPLIPGATAKYNAVVFKKQNWMLATESETDLNFRWSLVKLDSLGKPLALRDLGTGSSVDVVIPNDYKCYELLLTIQYLKEDRVVQKRSPLHTPLRN